MLFPKTKKKVSFSQTNSLLFSWPKTGKTTYASNFKFENKEPLFIMTESGEGILELSKARIKDWLSVIKLADLLDSKKTEIKEQYSCFVIDLISDLDAWSGEYIAKQSQVSHISDLPFGKGFSMQKQEFQRVITKLMDILPCHFISHTKEKDVNINGVVTKVQAPTMSAGSYEFINGKVDTIMFIRPANGAVKGAIVIEPSMLAVTGSRYPNIIGSHEFDGKNAGSVHVKLEKLFNKEV
jgi:hypothetical protein